MKKFKKIFTTSVSLLLALGIALSAAGCQNNGENNDKSAVVEDYADGRYYYDTGVDTTASYDVVKNGDLNYALLVASDVSAEVMTAANEMAGYVKRITGESMKIVTDEADLNGLKFISIGNTDVDEEFGADLSAIKDDGYYIKSDKDGNFYINGNLDRGVKYGIYDFSERFLGVRYLTEKATYIPENQNLQLHPCDIVLNPVFPMRYWYSGPAFLNSEFRDHCRYYEGKEYFCNDVSAVHNSTEYVSPDDVDPEDSEGRKLSETHPEYFSKFTNGSTTTNELCFTNGIKEDGTLSDGQSVASLMIDKIKSFLEADTEKKIQYFMVGKQDDRNANCLCQTCEERRKVYYDSGIWVMFINCVSRNVNSWLEETQHRKVEFIIFAYQQAENAPVIKQDDGTYKPISPLVVCDDNIYIRIAPIGADYTFSFSDERQLENQHDILFGWAGVSSHFMIWDYQCNFVEYFWYFPTTHYLRDNLVTYKELGAVYVMNQSSYTQSVIWFDYLRNYISSKLYWNLDWDVDKLIDEFISLYYDSTADYVKQIYALFDDYYAELVASNPPGDKKGKGSGFHLEILDAYSTSRYMKGDDYDIKWLTKIIDTIDSAMESINAEDIKTGITAAELSDRLEAIKLTPMRMILCNYTTYYSEDTRLDYAREFFALCDKYGITALGEGAGRQVAARKAELGLQ